MTFMDWFRAVTGGYPPNYTDSVNRQHRHCRIGRIKPVNWLYPSAPRQSVKPSRSDHGHLQARIDRMPPIPPEVQDHIVFGYERLPRVQQT